MKHFRTYKRGGRSLCLSPRVQYMMSWDILYIKYNFVHTNRQTADRFFLPDVHIKSIPHACDQNAILLLRECRAISPPLPPCRTEISSSAALRVVEALRRATDRSIDGRAGGCERIHNTCRYIYKTYGKFPLEYKLALCNFCQILIHLNTHTIQTRPTNPFRPKFSLTKPHH